MSTVDPDEDRNAEEAAAEESADRLELSGLMRTTFVGFFALLAIAKLVEALQARPIALSNAGFNVIGLSCCAFAMAVVIERAGTNHPISRAKQLAVKLLFVASGLTMLVGAVIGGILLVAAIGAANVDAALNAGLMLIIPVGGVIVWFRVRSKVKRGAL